MICDDWIAIWIDWVSDTWTWLCIYWALWFNHWISIFKHWTPWFRYRHMIFKSWTLSLNDWMSSMVHHAWFIVLYHSSILTICNYGELFIIILSLLVTFCRYSVTICHCSRIGSLLHGHLTWRIQSFRGNCRLNNTLHLVMGLKPRIVHWFLA